MVVSYVKEQIVPTAPSSEFSDFYDDCISFGYVFSLPFCPDSMNSCLLFFAMRRDPPTPSSMTRMKKCWLQSTVAISQSSSHQFSLLD